MEAFFPEERAPITVPGAAGRKVFLMRIGIDARRAGSIAGYRYSRALTHIDLVWTEATVDALFRDGPDAYLPGTKMPLQRMPSAEDRATLITYLKRITNAGD